MRVWPGDDLVQGMVLVASDAEHRVLSVTGQPLLVERAGRQGLMAGRPCPTELPGWASRAVSVPTGLPDADQTIKGTASVWWETSCPEPPEPVLALALQAAAAELRAAVAQRHAEWAKALAIQAGEELGGAGMALVTPEGEALFATDRARRLLGLPTAPLAIDLSVAVPFLWQRIRHMLTADARESEIYLAPPGVPIHCRVVIQRLDGAAAVIVHRDSERGRKARPGRPPAAKYRFDDLITVSDRMRRTLEVARAAAGGEAPVLLIGETGTGKELVAQAIHNASPRANGPFVAVNCGAIPAELIGSELFGHEPGAFTGARRDGAPGKFEQAHSGTLFLDEIGEMPLDLQVHLLRVLEQGEITRLGGQSVLPVDVRIIAATNRDMWELVQTGRFRADLYYRLNVMEVRLPPLRERVEDIPVLVKVFLQREAAAAGRSWQMDEAAMAALLSHSWPGNVRELYNAIKRATLLARGDRISLDHLPSHLRTEQGQVAGGPGPAPAAAAEAGPVAALADMERELILNAVRQAGSNISSAARMLGISRTTMYRKLGQIKRQ